MSGRQLQVLRRDGSGVAPTRRRRCAGQLHGRGLEALDRPEHDLASRPGSGSSLGVDDDDLAGAELLVEEPLGQRVLDQALDGPAQRPGAEGGVVAPVGEEQLGGLR